MALIKCPECGKEISDRAEMCVYCGYPLTSKKVEEDHSTDEKIPSMREEPENVEQKDNNIEENQSTTQTGNIEGFSSHINESDTQQSTSSKGLSENAIIALIGVALVIFFLWIFPAMNTPKGGGKCAWCGGTGYSGNGAKSATEYALIKTTCPHCHGTGRR